MTRRFAPIALLLAIALLVVPVSPSSAAPGQEGSSLSELQRRREQVRAEKAAQAGEVNALEASDAEVTSALNALSAQVEAQKDKVEEAERVLAKAEEDRQAAEAAQAAAQAELDALSQDIKESAVEAYVNVGSSNDVSTVGVDDVNDAVNKRMLIDSRATESADLVERFRSVQEDLELQRAAKAEAEERAAAEREKVADRKAELDDSYAEQQRFAEALDARLDAALAEAAALAELDSGLSQQIAAKQAEIAAGPGGPAPGRGRAGRPARRGPEGCAHSSPALLRRWILRWWWWRWRRFTRPVRRILRWRWRRWWWLRAACHHRVGQHRERRRHPRALVDRRQPPGAARARPGRRASGSAAAATATRPGRSPCAGPTADRATTPSTRCPPPPAARPRRDPAAPCTSRAWRSTSPRTARTLTRSSSGFQWLRANAGRFGFRNLPSEPWHWSTNGN